MLVTLSDHIIKNQKEYLKAVQRSQILVQEGNIITFGINPTSLETGFGYIEANGELVKAFHEKPDLDTATKYLNSKNYYWNSGMFCFQVKTFLKELSDEEQKILKKTQDIVVGKSQIKNIVDIEKQTYKRISILEHELDTVLGGGIVPGSLILIGGSPSVGKSTMLLKIASNLAKQFNVLYVSAEESANLRLLRGFKNRFGSTSEVGLFEMTQNGLSSATGFSSKFFSRHKGQSGSAATIVIEVNRPLILEVQALVAKAHLPVQSEAQQALIAID